ncbi:flagellar filament capping protein FliD [Clostridium sp.]|uniref:flagellar filament capping protein FliD n=1 Tax=Clostridium sp. TaxID=1506 RepID=UPI00290CC2BB|nr:flagellar filament capping protein FliD [Clostridium sp.]MDU5105251.1 flagellar filament capping protein FliD [Clostridium sp.]
MRITGLATGLDMDEIIKNSMKPYRIKIDKKGQDKEILEIKQKLYREVLKDSRDLYNKYFDVIKSDSLLLSKNWSTTKFTSSNENILTVTGSGDSRVDNYTITGDSAKAARTVLTSNEIIDNKIVINGKEFTLSGDSEREKANNLNNQLKSAGININVKYSDFAGNANGNATGFIFESTLLGKDNTFVINGKSDSIGIKTDYKIAKAANITDINISNFKIDDENIISFYMKDDDGNNVLKSINLEGSEIKNDDGNINKDKLIDNLNTILKEYNIEVTLDKDIVSFKSTKLGSSEDPNLKVNGNSGSQFLDGNNEVKASNLVSLLGNEKITVNGVLVDLSLREKKEDGSYKEDITIYLNKVLNNQGVNITVTTDGNNEYKLTSNNSGEKAVVDVGLLTGNFTTATAGRDGKITFTNSNGGIYTYEGISNTITLDGVEFKFNGDIPIGGVTVSGKQDVTSIKDNLVKFFNDYNSLVEKLNKLTIEKKNREYSPLTADQKKEMSEDEIKLWNSKVEQGQLSRDTDLTRINNSLKQAMRSLVDGTGLNLEKIGINPIKDYTGTKNGTYTIDENKLFKALSENSEEIMNMFIKSAPKDDTLSAGSKYAKTGIMFRLKDILYSETMLASATLLKKAGFEGTASAYNNEITLSIQKYEQKMKDMEKDFSRREQALYTKYANLETIMNKYNSQQSYLSQQLGLG